MLTTIAQAIARLTALGFHVDPDRMGYQIATPAGCLFACNVPALDLIAFAKVVSSDNDQPTKTAYITTPMQHRESTTL